MAGYFISMTTGLLSCNMPAADMHMAKSAPIQRLEPVGMQTVSTSGEWESSRTRR